MATIITWNDTAREYVADISASPPFASLIYTSFSWTAYLGALQADAESLDPVLATAGALRGVTRYVSKHVASSAAIIERAISSVVRRGDPSLDIGFLAAITRLSNPRLSNRLVGTGMNSADIPVGPGKWTGENPTAAEWGNQQPYLTPTVDSYLPPNPPVFGSPAFNTALTEVRTISDSRTPLQEEIANRWADAAGSATPLGHWNLLATELIIDQAIIDPLEQAKILCYLNAAMYDAGIACWKAKYIHWYLRPTQADPAITPPEGLLVPNFPSYPSGHACFSGAASRFLGLVFPSQASSMNDFAEEAAVSRIYAGFHYRFDNDEGLASGRLVGNAAFIAYQADSLGTD